MLTNLAIPGTMPAPNPLDAANPRDARGVYELADGVNGCRAFYAKIESGDLLFGTIRVVQPGEDADDVMLDLWDALDAADPEGRPALSLLRAGDPPTVPLGLTGRAEHIPPPPLATPTVRPVRAALTFPRRA